MEDRGPAGGRAQADINPDVERCDVFLGVLWRSWGTPTGDASSGFAEESGSARDRFRRTGSPDLWLYFKEPGEDAVDNEQLARVRAFRDEVQRTEAAFFKSFADLAEFERLFFARGSQRRSSKNRADAHADWCPCCRLVERLPHRPGLATCRRRRPPGTRRGGEWDGTRRQPLISSPSWRQDRAELGFMRRAGNLRMQAARSLLAAHEPHDAVVMLRRVLHQYIWWLQLDDAEMTLRDLDESWPPELATELRAWRACRGVLRDPAGAASRLEQALGLEHAFQVDPETDALWRGVLWRCWLHLGRRRIHLVLDDANPLPPLTTDVTIELNLLHADALRATGSPTADEVWQPFRLEGLQRARSDPATSAWIATRCARDKVAAELLSEAEEAYIDAASRWTQAGRNEQAALSYFSAQVAGRIADALNFTGWVWVRRPPASARQHARSPSGPASLRRRRSHSVGRARPCVALVHGCPWLQQRSGPAPGRNEGARLCC